ncbi:SUKH-4 family immunity protein [Streptomyces sp. NPDC048483]|uniref:SUKH-4 family immunity protein n=1 Tax=Streptomyces sp. NPDC048483 TaxID=3154927 RepID=UPI003448EA16
MESDRKGVWAPIEDELLRVLSLPLDCLAAAEHQVLPVGAAEEWGIPEADRAALREWGLPRLPLFTPRPQVGIDPVLVPNLAGDHERRLVKEGQRLYDLGFWGPAEDSCVVGVVPGEGRVLRLLPAPITVDDLPEILRPHHAGLHKPAVSLFSSSIAQYVETAWRWHAALQILRQIESPPHMAPEGEVVTHYDRLYACVDLIVDAVRRLDPGIAAEDRQSVWTELIREGSV